MVNRFQVLVAGERQLHFFYLDHQENSWERLNAGLRLQYIRRNLKTTSSLLPDFQLTLGSNRHMSVFGPRFCVADDEGFIRVSLRCRCQVQCGICPRCWKSTTSV